MNFEFSRQIFKKKKVRISKSIKIRPVEAELFHANRQTDTMKLTAAFRNSANAPKIILSSPGTSRDQMSLWNITIQSHPKILFP